MIIPTVIDKIQNSERVYNIYSRLLVTINKHI